MITHVLHTCMQKTYITITRTCDEKEKDKKVRKERKEKNKTH